jgi:Na+-translocating ferredoxin:NAD+ oxidoreductase RnfA subunit
MSSIGFFFYMLIVDNLVFSYGLGVDFVLYRENRGFSSLRLAWQGTLYLLFGGTLFWISCVWILQPLGLGFLREFFGLVLSMTLFVLQGFIDKQPLGKYLGCRTQYGNLFGSPTAFGFFMLIAVQAWSFLQVLLGALAAGIGIALVSGLVYHLRLRMKLEKIPKILQGEALVFFALGLLSLTFSFFERLSFFFLIS